MGYEHEKRTSTREPYSVHAVMELPDGSAFDVQVVDLSPGGLQIVVPKGTMPENATAEVKFMLIGKAKLMKSRCVLKWQKQVEGETVAGMAFLTPGDQDLAAYCRELPSLREDRII